MTRSDLTSQEKLALMMTGASSMRALARDLGITHQKLGRWLREGELGGVKAIPRDPFTVEGIDAGFQHHKRIAKAVAKADGLPFDPNLPVFMMRKPLKTGELGDRVFVQGTAFIHSELREKILVNNARSKAFFGLTVRSEIDLHAYAEANAVLVLEKSPSKRRRNTVESLTEKIMESFLTKFGKVDVNGDALPVMGTAAQFRMMFTEKESIAPGFSAVKAVEAIEANLKRKFEPASEFGAGFAESYVFQLLPASYEQYKRKSKAAKKTSASRKAIRGRGNK